MRWVTYLGFSMLHPRKGEGEGWGYEGGLAADVVYWLSAEDGERDDQNSGSTGTFGFLYSDGPVCLVFGILGLWFVICNPVVGIGCLSVCVCVCVCLRFCLLVLTC